MVVPACERVVVAWSWSSSSSLFVLKLIFFTCLFLLHVHTIIKF